MQWHKESWTQVERYLNTDVYSGLSDSEAERRLKESYDKEKIKNHVFKFKEAILKEISPLWILSNTAILYILFYFHYFNQGLFLSIIIGISLIIKTYCLFLSLRDYISLYKIDRSFVQVIRQNVHKRIKVKDLVLGDMVFLEKGIIVPADIRICEAKDLKINEKQITAQDVPAEKYETKIPYEYNSLSELTNMAFKGTIVTQGEGIGIVVEKGEQTEFGKIMESVNKKSFKEYNLINNIEGIYNKIELFMLLLGVLSIIYLKNKDVLWECLNIFINCITIYASIPVTISLHLFSYFMKREYKDKGIEIKDIEVLHRIKDIDAILIDKVGSISEENMFAKEIYTDEELNPIFKVNTNNYTFTRLMEIALLCNDASYDVQSNKGKGNIQEVALLRLAAGKFIYKGIMDSKYKRVMELPYEMDKRVKTIVNMVEDKYRVNIKGAVDQILENCTHFMKDGIEKELTQEDIENIKKADYDMSSRGLSTLGFAYRNFHYEPSAMENLASNLVFVGVIGFHNPIITKSSEYINILKEYNIVTSFITEDNKITAYSTAKELEMIKDMSQVISGVELSFLEHKEMMQVVSKVKVYSRINSEHRERIVNCFKEEKMHLAVTGEKISDLPALANSYLAITIGKSCSLNLKKLSHVYITRDYLLNFVYLVEKGIKNFNSLSKAFSLYVFTLFIEILLFIFYGIDSTYMVNSFILPLSTINLLINNKNEDKEIKSLSIRNILSTIETFKIILYFALCSISYYYSLNILGFLYKESTLFILITVILMRSFDYSYLYRKKFFEKSLYILLILMLFLVWLFYYKGFTGISAIMLNMSIIISTFIIELITVKWTK